MKQDVRWGGRVVAGLAALVLLTRCGAETPARETEDAECQTSAGLRQLALAPAADAYWVDGQESAVFGEERKLVADNFTRRSAYLHFAVPELPGPVQHVTLRLYALDGSVDGPKLYAATTDWTEGLLWSHQPPTRMGTPLSDVGLVPNGSWVEYDVTSTVTGSGAYGFALVTESRDGVDFASKEHVRREFAPRLLLTVDAPEGSGCGP
ncbi:DUF7594 domain-containing protein [Archangium sp.]|jgi:hypothetical protein|uniref:CBM96 family carbohydrate-binding protein n=1 Tax=Archangium sp. TaxID=1872627 RepID=UPI002EDB26E5